jgi:hypothetical protein
VSLDEEPVVRADVDLEEFLRILPHLEAADLMAMSATYRQGDAGVRDAARLAASGIAKERRLIDELGRVQGSIIQWAGSDISRSAAFTIAGVRPDQMLGDLRVEALPPLLDAATALLLGNLLDANAREALLEPWGSAVS